MSSLLISRSADLRRLRDEGYSVSLVSGHLLISDIPTVTKDRTVSKGTLITPLTMAGDVTIEPAQHMVFWSGDLPCDASGRLLTDLIQAEGAYKVTARLTANAALCNRLPGREFANYHELVTAYCNLISGHASALQPASNARSIVPTVGGLSADTAFRYIDTATARAGIGELSARLGGGAIAIVGLGGTGSYILDLVAKTPVSSIHLFDDDTFDQHNAFRSPGAPSRQEIAERNFKVDHFARIYSQMHRGIVPHRSKLTRRNLKLLDNIDFAFLCSDDAASKGTIIRALERREIAFIDVGIGVHVGARGISGLLRVTTSTPAMRDHIRTDERIPLAGAAEADPYASNVQVADLNALNAALAVIKWKRLKGFYADDGREHHSIYGLADNVIFNVDRSEDMQPGSWPNQP